MTTTTVLASFDNVKFVEGVTKLTQANWQSYFGAAIPNGIYSGFEVSYNTSDDSEFWVYDGVAFVNGMFVEVSTDNGYTSIGSIYLTDIVDRFVCLRVYFGEERACLVQKTDISPQVTNTYLMEYLMNFARDESYQCERNSIYYEIPIFYQSEKNWLWCGKDLRRVVNLSGIPEVNPNHTGMNPTSGFDPQYYTHLITGKNEFYITDDHCRLYLDYIDCPDEATVYIAPASSCEVRLYTMPYVNNVKKPGLSESTTDYWPTVVMDRCRQYFTFSDASWTSQSGGLYYSLTVTTGTVLRIKKYYTKTFVQNADTHTNFYYLVEKF